MNKFVFQLFLTNLVLYSYAQNNLGVKVGMNFSTVKTSSESGYTVLPNYNTGIVTKFKLNDKFLLNTELLLSKKGFSSLLIPAGTTATNLTYISIPALLEYQSKGKVYFQLGPELNFLINARMKSSRFDESVSENYKKFDLSIAGGIGFNLSRYFNLETRYCLGLLQIRQNNDFFYDSYKTRTAQLNLVYLFNRR